jgi:hypothetical protein
MSEFFLHNAVELWPADNIFLAHFLVYGQFCETQWQICTLPLSGCWSPIALIRKLNHAMHSDDFVLCRFEPEFPCLYCCAPLAKSCQILLNRFGFISLIRTHACLHTGFPLTWNLHAVGLTGEPIPCELLVLSCRKFRM